ncbi:MAG: UDP binding domain-containing protein, partial [Comamonas sp.]
FEPLLLNAVEDRNQAQRNVLFERISAFYNGDLKGKTIAVWGLAFKPNTDDMREAPSRNLLESLWAAGAKVQAYDPVAMKEAHRIYGERTDLQLVDNPLSAIQGANCLTIVTEWQIFRAPDFSLLAQTLADKMIFDGRNLFEPSLPASHGLGYVSIGRPVQLPR